MCTVVGGAELAGADSDGDAAAAAAVALLHARDAPRLDRATTPTYLPCNFNCAGRDSCVHLPAGESCTSGVSPVRRCCW